MEQSAIAFSFFALAAIATFVLYRFPPDQFGFYPRCPIHQYLHVLCPGCGATRALSALLHGHLIAALHLNAFAVLVLLPLAAIYFALCLDSCLRSESFCWPAVPSRVTICVIASAAAFTLIRNL